MIYTTEADYLEQFLGDLTQCEYCGGNLLEGSIGRDSGYHYIGHGNYVRYTARVKNVPMCERCMHIPSWFTVVYPDDSPEFMHLTRWQRFKDGLLI
jgi:hypothetical protein